MNPTRISPEREKELWRQHNIDSLLESASLPFTQKIQMLEEMEEVARAFHGGELPRSADEHEEPASADPPSLKDGEAGAAARRRVAPPTAP